MDAIAVTTNRHWAASFVSKLVIVVFNDTSVPRLQQLMAKRAAVISDSAFVRTAYLALSKLMLTGRSQTMVMYKPSDYAPAMSDKGRTAPA